jgi:hypothetical protein
MFMAGWSPGPPPHFQGSTYILREESPKTAIESRLRDWGLKALYRHSTEDTEIALCAMAMDCGVSDQPTYLLIVTACGDG